MGLVLREVKGSKLTIQEMDGNLTYLDGGITANTQNINAKLNLSDFNSYSSNTNTLIGTKLNSSDFNIYSSTTNTSINGKLNITDFNSYSSTTNNIINNKLNTSIFAAYTASTTSSFSGVTYAEFFAYTAATNTRINNKLDTVLYATFTGVTNTSIGNRLLISDFNIFTGNTLPNNYFRQNGNSFGGVATLGTNDSQNFNIRTSGLTRMTIASGGNIAINTTPSISRLELYQSGGTVFNVGGGVGNLFTVNDSNVGNLLTVQDISGNTIFLTTSSGQSGFNTSTITQSAQVQIDSTNKGFLPPRMTGAQAEAISSPAEGLLVYATISGTTITSKGWWGYDGSTWVKLN